MNAERAHTRGHVTWFAERGVVRFDERPQRGRLLRERDELIE